MEVQLYKSIENDLKEKIRRGELKPGDKLPSEADLMADYQASKMTVRRSISNMEREGIIYSIERVGNYVATSEKDEYRLAFDTFEKINGVDEIRIHKVSQAPGEECVSILRGFYSEKKRVAVDVKSVFCGQNAFSEAGESDACGFALQIERRLENTAIKKELLFEAVVCPEPLEHELGVEIGEPIAKITQNYYDREGKLSGKSETYCLKEFVELRGYSV